MKQKPPPFPRGGFIAVAGIVDLGPRSATADVRISYLPSVGVPFAFRVWVPGIEKRPINCSLSQRLHLREPFSGLAFC